MAMKDLHDSFDWESPTFDPNDEYFGDVIESIRPSDAEEYDMVLVGEPYDGGQVSIRGASRGPEGLRLALAETKTTDLHNNSVRSIADLGDIDIQWGKGVRESHKQIINTTQELHKLETIPLFMGGGHDLAYPNVAPIIEQYDSVGVINLDSHADVREVIGNPYNGTPFRQAFDDGLDDYALVGARHFETSGPYIQYLEDRECEIISAEAVGSNPGDAAETALDSMPEVDAIHVSCDLDVLDMSIAPATTAPTPGGLLTRELYTVLRSLAQNDRVVSFDLIGCAPPLESSVQRLSSTNIGRTAIAGSRAIAHFAGGLHSRFNS